MQLCPANSMSSSQIYLPYDLTTDKRMKASTNLTHASFGHMQDIYANIIKPAAADKTFQFVESNSYSSKQSSSPCKFIESTPSSQQKHCKNSDYQSTLSQMSAENLRSPINGVRILPPDSAVATGYMSTPISNSSPSSSLTGQQINQQLCNESRGRLERGPGEVNALRRRLTAIPNRIGDYICQLCFTWFPDALQLADHPCPRMTTLSYPCPTCNKVFNCPANLASHCRWHRPRTQSMPKDYRHSLKLKSRGMTCSSGINSSVPYLIESTRSEVDPDDTLFFTKHINKSFRVNKSFRKTGKTETRKPAPFSVAALLA